MDLDEIKSDDYKDLHCSKCPEWLKLEYRLFNEKVDGIQISIDKLPLLVCPSCGEIYFPLKTRLNLRGIIAEAKERAVDTYRGTRMKDAGKQKFNFCPKVNFEYDSTDYFYIPGLIRPWMDGALTPVFFDKKVLQKFRSDPDYILNQGSNTYGTIYHPHGYISYGITRNDKIVCWLCDLDKLPEDEQQYFKSFNIPSDHDIASEFYGAQIEVVVGTFSNENQIFENIKSLNKKFEENFGFEIFKQNDEEKLQKISRPIFWDDDNLEPIINSLNKTCIESINQEALKSDISKKDPDFDISGLRGLKLLEKSIEINFPELDATKIMKPFFVLYDFRQVLSHDTGSKKEQILTSCYERMSVSPEKGFEGLYDSIVQETAKSLDEIINYEIKKEEL